MKSKRTRKCVGQYNDTKNKCISDKFIIYCDDCAKRLSNIPDNSVDSIVTDPPYGISFQNRKWDYNLPSTKIFRKMFDVMKPGGTLLCFASPSTQHRMAVNIEDAGFEIRDCLMWLTGSGLPKSQSIIDLIKKKPNPESKDFADLIKMFDGYRTHALKPAYEPIIMAMKPMEGNYVDNAIKYKVSGLNIDACRLEDKGMKWEQPRGGIWKTNKEAKAILVENTVGRFPSNLIYEDNDDVRNALIQSIDESMKMKEKDLITRIFYCAKVKGKHKDDDENTHPTIKPIPLMRYLCRLVKTPSGCVILDPFMGSGSTGVACLQEDIRFIGIEKEEEYYDIAKNRLTEQSKKETPKEVVPSETAFEKW